MQWRKKHPWDGQYAIPKNVMDEPARFQTYTTRYRRRRSIGPLGMRPPGWSPHLALPAYIAKEQVGQGALRTKYRPRRSVSTLIPNYLGNYTSELGASHDQPMIAGGPNDPIARFGEQVSTLIMANIMKMPPPMRKDALRSLFNELDPNLWSIVSRKADNLVKTRDMGPMEALEKAIAASTSLGLLNEILKMGKKRQGPKLKSLAGLGAYGDAAEVVVLDGYMNSMQALGWCGPVCQSKRAGSKLASVATTATKTVTSAATTAGKTVYSAGKTIVTAPVKYTLQAGSWVGGKVSSGAKAVYSFGKNVVSTIGNLACKVISSDVGATAAVVGATASGVPPQVGMVGAQVGRQICNGGPAPAVQELLPPPKKFPTLLVVGGGAAALGVLYLITRKR